ncbi:MAG: Gfo/Idh/MocA family oxidoreductase [Amphiplicatus sp.]
MKSFRIGLLGAAKIAPKAIIAPAASIPSAVIAGVAARDPARAESFAKRHGVAAAFGDYAALIASPDIDLIYNGLPISGHAAWTIKALEAGKHVLCEKPLAMNAEEARAMIGAASASGARLIEAVHCRYHKTYIAFLDRLKDIGDIRSMKAHFNVAIADNGTEIRHRPEHGGGAMMDLGCYPLGWALNVFDAAPEKVEAKATLTKSGVDESMETALTFAGGAVAHLSTSMAAGEEFSASIEVVGSNGRIEFENPIHPHQPGRPASLKVVADGREELLPIGRVSTYVYQLEAALDALVTGEKLPTEGAPMLRQQETLDAVYAAAGLGHLRVRA